MLMGYQAAGQPGRGGGKDAKAPKLLPRQVKVHSKCLNHEDEALPMLQVGQVHLLTKYTGLAIKLGAV